MVDDYLIATKTNVTRRYHPFQKYSGNPVVKVDQPWEADTVKCATVMSTEDGTGFRMWYGSWTHTKGSKGSNPLYAISKDGIHWEKPKMGMTTWSGDGSRNNNIVSSPGNIMHTPWEKDPELRYHGIGGGYYGMASPDGLHWKRLADHPSVTGGGDVGRFMWDPHRKEYLAYVKLSADVSGLRRRAIGFASCADLIQFPPLHLIIAPDDIDDRWTIPGTVQRTHFYGCNFFAYESMYLGLLWIFRGEELEEGYFHGPMFIELISSRDGIHWLREEGDRPPMLALGKPPRSWDQGMLCGVPPILVGNEMRLYYTGYDGPHDWLPFHAGIGLATLPKDRFASLDGGESSGEVLTKRLKGLTGSLRINCQSQKGSIHVELVDGNGNVVPGYARNDCDAVQTDSVDQVVTWHGKSDLPALAEPLRLRFIIHRAALYSFRSGENIQPIDEPARPELQVLYTFEGGLGKGLSDTLLADGPQNMHILGTAKLDREPAHAAFGKGSMSIGSRFRPLSRLELENTRNLGTRFTLAAMVKSEDSRYARLFSSYRGNYPTNTTELIFDFDPQGRSVAGLRLVCKGIPVESDALSFADDKYHHLGVTYDDGVVDFYLDGKPAGRRYLPGGAPVTLSHDLLVGEDLELGSDEQLRGNIDDLLVLGRALTVKQMAQLARDGAEKLLTNLDGLSEARRNTDFP